MSQTIDDVYRDFVTPGVPASGDYKPKKPEIRALLKAIQNGGGMSVTRNTFAQLDGVTPPTEDYMGVVLNDPDPTKNGYYSRVSAVWSFGRGFPDTFAELTDVGGSANAVTASISSGVDPSDIEVYFIEPTQTNTTDVTLNGLPVLNVGGDALSAGDWTAGRMILLVNRTTEWRLLSDPDSDGNAAAAAASAATAVQAAVDAQGGLGRPFNTIADAEAYNPVTPPDFFDVAFYDNSQQAGSGARYTLAASEPTHSGKIQITEGSWYEISTEILRPEMFGQIGVNAAADTAAWVAMATTANSRSVARVDADGEYLIAGSDINFTGPDSIYVRLGTAVLRQQTNLSMTLKFTSIPLAVVTDGELHGRGGAAGEYDGASSSNNGVAGLFFSNCDTVEVYRLRAFEHSNPAVFIYGGRVRKVRDCYIEGIGYPYIDPIGQGNQGNNSDFGIQAVPSNNIYSWTYEDEFCNNRIFDHAFGIQTVATKSSIIHGNVIGPCPGQHGIYGIENHGVSWVGNIIRECRQHAGKLQLENYAGQFIGTVWATATGYVVGDEVRQSSNLYICLTAHTSGTFATDLAANKWLLSPKNFIEGGVIANNVVEDCGNGLSVLETSLVTPYYKFVRGLIVSGNIFRRSGDRSIIMERALDCDVINNTFIDDVQMAVWLKNFSGRCSGNTFLNSGWSGIYLACAGVAVGATLGCTWIEDNHFIDCGLDGTDDDKKVPMVVNFLSDTPIPGLSTTKFVRANRNEIRFTTGDAAGPWLAEFADVNVVVDINDTRCNPGTAKVVKVDGSIGAQFRNDYPGYVNSAQNAKDYTSVNGSNVRSFDASSADLSVTKNVLFTLINDLIATQIIK